MKNRKVSMLATMLLTALFVFTSCELSKETQTKRAERKMYKELRQVALKTAKEIAPQDLETPAEQGGYGFEKLSAEQGYQTYVVPKDEYKYFGDSRALKGGILTSIVSRFPATMRTEGKNSNYRENYTYRDLLYEGMLDMNPVTQKYMPFLATHWKISADKMQFWFRLNPDARWSDGKPVTTADVLATYNLHMDETILSPSDQLTYAKFEKPVAESKYIVSVKCKTLNWRNFLYFSTGHIYPSHYLKGLSGTDYLKEYQYKVLPGTGPYTILEQDIKNQVSYAITRRLDYWDAANPLKKNQYNFDKVKYSVVKDNTTLEFEKLKKGDQDFYTVLQARMWVDETDFEAVMKGWVQKRKIFSQRPSGHAGYAFNMRKPPFNDRRIRYAFAYLLNRTKMNAEMYYNEYLLQDSLYAGSVYENPNNEKIRYNPEKAIQLLAEAGWKERNEQGWLVNDKGEAFQLEINIPKSIDYMVTPYQQMLKEFGIDFQIKFMDTNTLWKLLMDRNFTIHYESWGGLTFPNPETSLHSSIADKKNNNNITGFKDKRVDELCDLYDQEFDLKKRIEIIREIDGIVSDVLPSLYTNFRPYQRLIYWDKFGYPDYMVKRYIGDFRSIFNYWWFDPQKVKRLYDAMAKDETLPQGEMNVTYWPDLVKKERQEEEASKK
ncbi:ABC transporter substrate-binding protein [candidate division CSSED10-310 bacterium]|uniref:ABC transporter substrate-binding protein n=1 Tax=candidate division CSSED10-310 bacterium TaxID=2855610 RepID=A0ABV6Z4W0_UNCC1